MNTLERDGTAPFMRRKGSAGPDVVSSYVFSAFEDWLERAINVRTNLLLKQSRVYTAAEPSRYWTPRSWGTGGPPTLVFLDATGATMIDPHVSPHATGPHVVIRSLLPAELIGTHEDLDALEDLDAGWNGHDVAAPRIEAIHKAAEWIEQIYEEVSRSGLAWRKPHVAADENGDVTFEWWNEDKGLTVYVSVDGNVSYLKDWGLDMEDEMEVGSLSTPEQRHDIWAWFVQQ